MDMICSRDILRIQRTADRCSGHTPPIPNTVSVILKMRAHRTEGQITGRIVVIGKYDGRTAGEVKSLKGTSIEAVETLAIECIFAYNFVHNPASSAISIDFKDAIEYTNVLK